MVSQMGEERERQERERERERKERERERMRENIAYLNVLVIVFGFFQALSLENISVEPERRVIKHT